MCNCKRRPNQPQPKPGTEPAPKEEPKENEK